MQQIYQACLFWYMQADPMQLMQHCDTMNMTMKTSAAIKSESILDGDVIIASPSPTAVKMATKLSIVQPIELQIRQVIFAALFVFSRLWLVAAGFLWVYKAGWNVFFCLNNFAILLFCLQFRTIHPMNVYFFNAKLKYKSILH